MLVIELLSISNRFIWGWTLHEILQGKGKLGCQHMNAYNLYFVDTPRILLLQSFQSARPGLHQ